MENIIQHSLMTFALYVMMKLKLLLKKLLLTITFVKRLFHTLKQQPGRISFKP